VDRDNIRGALLEVTTLLATPSAQAAYAAALKGGAGHPCAELTEMFTDLYCPSSPTFASAFSATEALELAHLYGVLMECRSYDFSSVSELHKQPMWRRAMRLSAEIQRSLANDA
jgi:hypothetical protein